MFSIKNNIILILHYFESIYIILSIYYLNIIIWILTKHYGINKICKIWSKLKKQTLLWQISHFLSNRRQQHPEHNFCSQWCHAFLLLHVFDIPIPQNGCNMCKTTQYMCSNFTLTIPRIIRQRITVVELNACVTYPRRRIFWL